MAYPNTNLINDQADLDYGGAPAGKFGIPARAFINSVLQFLSAAYLKYLRQPYMQIVVVSSSGNVVGDVCYFDEGTFVTGSGYYARNKTGGTATADFIGVFLEGASPGAKARVAFFGLIPPAVSGLGTLAAATPISVNAGTGKLQSAANGDVVVGKADIQGNVLLFAPGRLL